MVRPSSSYHPTASLEYFLYEGVFLLTEIIRLGNSAVSVDTNVFQRTQPDMKTSQAKTAANLKSTVI